MSNIVPLRAALRPVDAPLTMSSREIADLCGKRHDHVLRDIEQMLQDITQPKFGFSEIGGAPKFGASSFEAEYITTQNKRAKEYRLPKDLTLTLVTGYRADLRFGIIKRLEELEQQTRAPALPNFANPAEAARAWADQVETAQRLAVAQQESRLLIADQREVIAEQAPAVAAQKLLEGAEGSMSLRDAAKHIGAKPNKFNDWLRRMKWIYRTTGRNPRWAAYSDKIASGHMQDVAKTIEIAGTGFVAGQAMVTPKGLARLARLFEEGKRAAA